MRKKLIELLERAFERFIDDPYCIPDEREFADHLIANDVVPVVRCEKCCFTQESPYIQCVWCNKHHKTMKATDFCSYGERRAGE